MPQTNIVKFTTVNYSTEKAVIRCCSNAIIRNTRKIGENADSTRIVSLSLSYRGKRVTLSAPGCVTHCVADADNHWKFIRCEKNSSLATCKKYVQQSDQCTIGTNVVPGNDSTSLSAEPAEPWTLDITAEDEPCSEDVDNWRRNEQVVGELMRLL